MSINTNKHTHNDTPQPTLPLSASGAAASASKQGPKLKFRLNAPAVTTGNAVAGPSREREEGGGEQAKTGRKIKLKGKLAEKGQPSSTPTPSTPTPSNLKLKLNVRPTATPTATPPSQPPQTPAPAPSLKLKIKPLALSHPPSKPAVPSPLAGSPISAKSFLADAPAGSTAVDGAGSGARRKLKLNIRGVRPQSGLQREIDEDGESSVGDEEDAKDGMMEDEEEDDEYSPHPGGAEDAGPSDAESSQHPDPDADDDVNDDDNPRPRTSTPTPSSHPSPSDSLSGSLPPPTPSSASSAKKPRKGKSKKWILSKKRKTKSQHLLPLQTHAQTQAYLPVGHPSGDSTPSGPSASPQPMDIKVPLDEDGNPVFAGVGTGTPSREGTSGLSGMETPFDGMGVGTPGVGTPLGGRGRPYLRVKKPLRECLKKIMVELKRKDIYGLFYDPVDPVEYPGYFAAIGGPENAMDFSTMDQKIDDKAYRVMDDFETDVHKMTTACEVFNGEGSHAYKNAGIIKALADKLIDRYRPIIRTPSPSPVRQSTAAAGTPGAASASPGARSVSPANHLPQKPPIPPKSLIPEAMLAFPPGSDVARAVGYYATGGKRARTKKEVRAREKWDGQWREWYTEGDRNLIEADDVAELFSGAEGSGKELGFVSERVELPKGIDWKDPVMRSKEVWVAPPIYVGLQREESPPPFPTRVVGPLDFGKCGDLPRDFGIRRTDPAEEQIVQTRIRREAATLDPWEYVKEATMGEGVIGEAYLASIDAFVRGAELSVKRGAIGDIRKRKAAGWVAGKGKRKREGEGEDEGSAKRVKVEEATDSGEIKMEEVGSSELGVHESDPVKGANGNSTAATKDAEEPDHLDLEFAGVEDGSLGRTLVDYIHNEWRDGFINRDLRKVTNDAAESYRSLKLQSSIISPLPDDSDPTAIPSLVKSAVERVPLLRELAWYSAKNDGVDLASLLHSQADFGMGSGPGPGTGPGRAIWFHNSLEKAGRQIKEAERRRVERGGAELDAEEQAKLRQLRLDLLSLAKNVPVYELKPMTQQEAERLPPAVRGLIKVIPAK